MVPAGGRANVTYPFSPSRRTMKATPAWYPATYQLRGRQPRGWATRLSPPAVNRSSPSGGPSHMFRVQAPLAERYTNADPDDLDAVEEAWESLEGVIDIDRLVPITYMNSSAALKAFVGQHGGAVCTSSNARAVITWALERGERLLFFPDQHLGRNTAFQLGFG